MINDLNDPHPHDRRLAQLREETPQDVARKHLPEVAAWVLGFIVAVVVAVLLTGLTWLLAS